MDADEQNIEALAVALYTKDKPPGSSDWKFWYEHNEAIRDIWRGYARRFLESDWLAEHDRQIASETFDEGYEAAYGDLLDRDPHRTKNPYAQGETP